MQRLNCGESLAGQDGVCRILFLQVPGRFGQLLFLAAAKRGNRLRQSHRFCEGTQIRLSVPTHTIAKREGPTVSTLPISSEAQLIISRIQFPDDHAELTSGIHGARSANRVVIAAGHLRVIVANQADGLRTSLQPTDQGQLSCFVTRLQPAESAGHGQRQFSSAGQEGVDRRRGAHFG
jgi:hypothetical protein